MKPNRILLAGGSGFLGQALARHFTGKGHDVVVLTRQPRANGGTARERFWDGCTLGDWGKELEGALAVINLCGRSVDCRYTAANRREILGSRVNSTRAVGEAIARCTQPPRVWLNASSATIYCHTFGPAWDESATDFAATPEVKDEFSLEVIHAWEQELNAESLKREDTPLLDPASSGTGILPVQEGASKFLGALATVSPLLDRRDARPTTIMTRKVALRMTMALGHARNSVFPVLRRLARLGLGGRMGDGRQFVSWMHVNDFCRAVEWIIGHDELRSPVNIAAPNPLPNAEMMRIMRELCGVPFGLPAARWMLEVGAFFLRTETELILKSRRVTPGKLLASGFQFQFPTFVEAVKDLAAA